MSDSTQPPAAPAPIPAIPVICDKCRATGMAGDEAFAAIPDILEFTPVPRRAHANGWTPEHQRAFIAALAITDSPRQACRHVGRAQFGAEQLRTAKGGRSFAAAWDAALDLARDRELARLHENLGDLAAKTEAERAQISPSPLMGEGRGEGGDYDDDDGAYEREMEEVRERLWNKLQKLRLQTLREVMHDPEKRSAYDIVYGRHDWEAIKNGTWKGIAWQEENEPPSSSSPTQVGDPASSPSPLPRAQSRGTPEDKAGPRVRRV